MFMYVSGGDYFDREGETSETERKMPFRIICLCLFILFFFLSLSAS